jgi:hypothetical protein
MSEQPTGGGTDGNAGTLVRTVVTVVLLLAFGVLVVVMIVTSDSLSEVAWNRRVYLLGGVEAIVFTSVGWLFGREVHPFRSPDGERGRRPSQAGLGPGQSGGEGQRRGGGGRAHQGPGGQGGRPPCGRRRRSRCGRRCPARRARFWAARRSRTADGTCRHGRGALAGLS